MTDSEYFFGFVYGEENRACIRTLREFADRKCGDAEPILLIGRSGLGKTHLLHTLYRRMRANPSFDIVLYRTGENLIADIICNILKDDTGRDTFSCYRNLDMLLVDDLSCLYGKHSTQQTILYFLDDLKRQDVRVLCTLSDGSVSEELIASRFPGKILKLAIPSVPTVKRIIEYKAADHGLTITGNQAARIAAKTRGNGFLIEGMIKRYAFQKSVVF